MECSLPPPLTDDQITAAVDGEADQGVKDHVARCPGCAARVEQARHFEHLLRHQLNRWDCPTPEQLGDYHFNLLSDAERVVVSLHLKRCARCREEPRQLESFNVAEQSDLTATGNPRMERVKKPSEKTKHQVAAPLGRLREFVARIVPQSPLPASALRGADSGPIVAESDGLTVFLELEKLDSGLERPDVRLKGQLVADDLDTWTAALVELRQSGALQTTAFVGDLGSFQSAPFSPEHGVPGEIKIRSQRGINIIIRDIAFT